MRLVRFARGRYVPVLSGGVGERFSDISNPSMASGLAMMYGVLHVRHEAGRGQAGRCLYVLLIQTPWLVRRQPVTVVVKGPVSMS